MLCTKRAGWGVLDKDPNPASATNDDMTSCNSNELCRFFVSGCQPRQILSSHGLRYYE